MYDFGGKGLMCVTLVRVGNHLLVDYRKSSCAVLAIKSLSESAEKTPSLIPLT